MPERLRSCSKRRKDNAKILTLASMMGQIKTKASTNEKVKTQPLMKPMMTAIAMIMQTEIAKPLRSFLMLSCILPLLKFFV